MSLQTEWIIQKIASEMDQGHTRDQAFYRFKTSSQQAIQEWTGHIAGLQKRFSGQVPDFWGSVINSVMCALSVEARVQAEARELEASDWHLEPTGEAPPPTE